MPVKIKDIRRRELIEATREIIQEYGFEKATISLIAKKAGFSIGYIHHHFKNKDELLAGAIRVLYAEMPKFLAEELPKRHSPRERPYAIIEANLHPHLYTRLNAFAWISHMARVPFHDEYNRIQTAVHNRLNSNLMHEFRQLLSEDDAIMATEEISVLLDGYWIRLGVSGDITPEHALSQTLTAVDRILGVALPTVNPAVVRSVGD